MAFERLKIMIHFTSENIILSYTWFIPGIKIMEVYTWYTSIHGPGIMIVYCDPI
jgi:hypothetical protein